MEKKVFTVFLPPQPYCNLQVSFPGKTTLPISFPLASTSTNKQTPRMIALFLWNSNHTHTVQSRAIADIHTCMKRGSKPNLRPADCVQDVGSFHVIFDKVSFFYLIFLL